MRKERHSFRWRRDVCSCGFRRIIGLEPGVSVMHKSKCPECKRTLGTSFHFKVPEGMIVVGEEREEK